MGHGAPEIMQYDAVIREFPQTVVTAVEIEPIHSLIIPNHFLLLTPDKPCMTSSAHKTITIIFFFMSRTET
jgi:hypothetical protein